VPRCIITEDNKVKQKWDFYIILIILYVALVVPYRMAFDSKDTTGWKVWSTMVDVSFGMDIVFTFFSAYSEPETGMPVYDKKEIAKQYLKGWFWIDTFSILPIESFFNKIFKFSSKSSGSGINVLAKFPRIARIYSLVRFIRLTKLMRLMKKKQQKKGLV